VTTETTTAQVEGPRRPSPCHLGTAATVKSAIFPLGLLLFYIVYNGGKLLCL